MSIIDISKTLAVSKLRKPKTRDITPFNGDIKSIVIHTTNSEHTITGMAKYHTKPSLTNHISKLGCPTYCYHDTIKPGGNIYHCVDYDLETWHAGNFNKRSVAVALNFIAEQKGISFAPDLKMMVALYKHTAALCLKFGVTPINIVGHREIEGSGWFWSKGSKVLRKTCPGIKIDMDDTRYYITKYIQLILKANKLYLDYKVDGIFGVKTWCAFRDYINR